MKVERSAYVTLKSASLIANSGQSHPKNKNLKLDICPSSLEKKNRKRQIYYNSPLNALANIDFFSRAICHKNQHFTPVQKPFCRLPALLVCRWRLCLPEGHFQRQNTRFGFAFCRHTFFCSRSSHSCFCFPILHQAKCKFLTCRAAF